MSLQVDPSSLIGKTTLPEATREAANRPADAALHQQPGVSIMTPQADDADTQQAKFLTVEMLRTELLALNIEPSPQNITVAESLAKLGLPITTSIMAEAHSSLTVSNGALPASYALAKLLDMPPSPAVLRGISAVMTATAMQSPQNISVIQAILPSLASISVPTPVDSITSPWEVMARRKFPKELLKRLGLTFDLDSSSADLSEKIASFSKQILKSTENRILHALKEKISLETYADLRTVLMQIASEAPDEETRIGAKLMNMLIDGQQVINKGARSAEDTLNVPAAYISMPVLVHGERSTIEMKLWPRDKDREAGSDYLESMPLRACIRLDIPPLGKIQADLSGQLHGELRCRIWAQQPAVTQLISRNASHLSDALVHAGWPHVNISCRVKMDWPPLWSGGQSLCTPRNRVDQKV